MAHSRRRVQQRVGWAGRRGDKPRAAAALIWRGLETMEPRLLLNGDPGATLFLAEALPGSDVIAGQKYHDRNGNGQRDPGEEGLNGFAIQLIDGMTGEVVGIQFTTSIDLDDSGDIDPFTEDGWYYFADLEPGTYVVREVPQEGWVQSDPANNAFASPTVVSTQDRPHLLFAGDLDGDGDIDLLMVEPYEGELRRGGRLTVLTNNGTGQFTATHSRTIDHDIRLFTVGDVDGDGDLDLIGVGERYGYSNGGSGSGSGYGYGDYGYDHFVKVYLNDGFGGFGQEQESIIGQNSQRVFYTALSAGDLDGDGDLDLVYGATAYGLDLNLVVMLTNDGAGNFSLGLAEQVPSFVTATAIGDIDDQGDLDVVVATYDTGNDSTTVFVLFNTSEAGQLSFHPAPAATLPTFTGKLLLGDLDGDGDLDVVAVERRGGYYGYGNRHIHVLLNDENTGLNLTQSFTGTGEDPGFGQGNLVDATLGDLDGDGDLDLITSFDAAGYYGDSATVGFFVNDGLGQFSTAALIPMVQKASQVVAGDLDGDGDLDVAVGVANPYFSQGSGSGSGSGSGGGYTGHGVVVLLNDGAYQIEHATGAAHLGQDFGNYQPASIEGVVFDDQDGDGFFGQFEWGIAGVTVFLDDNGNGELDEGERFDVTDFDGFYRFGQLRPGEYEVAILMPENQVASAPFVVSQSLAVSSGDAFAGVDFALRDQRFIVTNTNDSGPGSLRAALEALEAFVPSSEIVLQDHAEKPAILIEFRIGPDDPGFVDVDQFLPGGAAAPDVFVIQLLTQLPAIALPFHAVIISGHTQTAFAGDSNPFGPEIVLDGGFGQFNGLVIHSGGNHVQGLTIHRFGGHAVLLDGGVNNVIADNYLGLDATGMDIAGNSGNGVTLQNSHGNLIRANVIAGNDHGISLGGEGSNDNVIIGNRIGTDASGDLPLSNAGAGVFIASGSFNVVGEISADHGNVIAFNGAQGVRVAGGQFNSIRGNSILSNGLLGIDLGPLGVTANDALDADQGPNDLLNFPVVTTAISGGGQTLITGTLHSGPDQTFTVDLYDNTQFDTSGHGEGRTYLGSVAVTTNDSGDGAFSHDLDFALPAGRRITATSTDAQGNTSEFSASVIVVQPDTTAPVVTIDILVTNDPSPQLTGTVDDPTATIVVTVIGDEYTATNNGNGTWTLPGDTIDPPLEDGVYDVAVSATDPSQNVGTDQSSDELTIDTTAPVVTVNPLLTNNPTPDLTGTVDDPEATIVVTLNGVTYEATNQGDGTWTLAGSDLADALAEGVYDVQVSAADALSNTGVDDTLDELVIDLTAPQVAIDPLVTNDTTPTLTGTVDDPEAAVSVTLGETTYLATNLGDGTWSLDGDVFGTGLLDDVYDVQVRAQDAAGNAGFDNTVDELVIDTVAPQVTVAVLVTSESSPALTGTVDDPSAVVRVLVNERDYLADNNGDGTWTLAANSITPALGNGVYNVVVTATDAAGNVGADDTVDELTIQTSAPTVTVEKLLTSDPRPNVTGMVDDPEAFISVVINDVEYEATNNGDGTWTLSGQAFEEDLADGTYDVMVSATNAANNTGFDNSSDELTIDTVAPLVTVNPLTTDDTTPPLSGTVDDPDAVVQVLVNGVVYEAVNDGQGGWSIADDVIGPLESGAYDVVVTATDEAGNVGADDTVDELVIDATPVNLAPAFTSAPVTEAVQDQTYTYNVSATDENAEDVLTITAITLPAWLTITDHGDGTATLAGTPGNDEVGDHAVTLQLSDGAETVTQTFTITVENVNDEPFFTSEPATDATQDQPYLYNITADDIDAEETLTITAATVPAWLTLTDNGDGTATLTGTPGNDEVGDHAVVLELSDGQETVTQTFTITVANVNDAPIITQALPDVTVNQDAADHVVDLNDFFADIDAGDSLTYSVAGNSNAGLVATSIEGGVLTLSFAGGNNGVATITVHATDGAGAVAEQTFTVTIHQTIGDFVWHDLNGNGVQDEGEPGLTDVRVDLFDAATETLLDTVFTDAAGHYRFDGVTPGTYFVVFHAPSGFEFTLSNQGGDETRDSDAGVGGRTQSFVITPGPGADVVDAGLLQPGQVTGRVFHDRNANGVFDEGDLTVPGATVYLDFNGNGVLDDDEPTSLTDNSGAYFFGNLFPGDYRVRVVLPDEALASLPAQGAGYDVFVASGQSLTGLDFGHYFHATIFGVKFEDFDADGVRAEGEPPLAGFTIYLDLNGNGQLDEGEPTAVTDATGQFAFTGLEPGDYLVAEVQQPGFVQTFPLGDGSAHVLTLHSGQTVFNAHFGNHVPGEHADLVSQLTGTDLHRTFVPGDQADFDVTVANIGQAGAQGGVIVRVYLSLDGVLDEGDILLAEDAGNVNLAAGRSTRFRFRNLPIGDDIAPGHYHVITEVIGDESIAERNTANNAFVAATPHQLALLFGEFDGRRNVTLLYHGVEYSLRGGGFGELTPRNSESFISSDGAFDLAFHDTTGRSTARIKTPRGETVALGDVVVHQPMNRLNFGAANLFGDITAAQELARIDLNHVIGPSTITLGNSKSTRAELKFYANHVNDLSIISGNAINRIDVASWASTDEQQDLIQTRAVKTFKARELVRGLDLLVSQTFGSFTAATMQSSNLIVGGVPDTAALPQNADQILNKLGSIRSVKLTGRGGTPTFVDSRIAAWSIRTANLGVVDTDNGGTPFGVAANTLHTLRRTGPALAFPTSPGDATDGDFIVRLV